MKILFVITLLIGLAVASPAKSSEEGAGHYSPIYSQFLTILRSLFQIGSNDQLAHHERNHAPLGQTNYELTDKDCDQDGTLDDQSDGFTTCSGWCRNGKDGTKFGSGFCKARGWGRWTCCCNNGGAIISCGSW